MSIMDTLTDFTEMINVKFVIATVIMLIIFLVICYLLLLIVQSIQKRSEAINVKFPSIDDYGEGHNKKQFNEGKEITVELVNSEDDVVKEKVELDEDLFLSALSSEIRKPLIDDELQISMPEVGEIDYDKIKKERKKELEVARLEQERASQERLRELALADNEDELEIK